MKKIFLLLGLALVFNGCALIPKPVEFGQKKVAHFPVATARQQELGKEAALLAKQKAQTTLEAAIKYNADTNIVTSAEETAKLTDVVSEVVGPPKKEPSETVDQLVDEVRTALAKQDAKIESFKQKNDEVAGKKIEGTGFLQIPYFVYLAVVILVLVIGWHLAHTVLVGLQMSTPIAPAAGIAGTVGNAAMSEIESLFSKGFSTVKADILKAVQGPSPPVTSK